MLVCPKVAASPAGRVLVHGVQEVTVDEDQANLAAAGHLPVVKLLCQEGADMAALTPNDCITT